jgi:hypothetical protein
MNKKTWMFVLTAAALFVTVGSASLSADSFNPIRANIPFGFMVGSEAFPAGSYSISRVDNVLDALVLRRTDGGKNVVFVPIGAYSAKARREDSLVFNRYGDEYFLKEVWTAENPLGRQLIPSHRERELSVSMNQDTPEVVAIAATR